MMFIHLEANEVRLHMNIDDCFFNNCDKVEIHRYGFINLDVFLNEVQYLSCFDKGNCTLLIKEGEILKEKLD